MKRVYIIIIITNVNRHPLFGIRHRIIVLRPCGAEDFGYLHKRCHRTLFINIRVAHVEHLGGRREFICEYLTAMTVTATKAAEFRRAFNSIRVGVGTVLANADEVFAFLFLGLPQMPQLNSLSNNKTIAGWGGNGLSRSRTSKSDQIDIHFSVHRVAIRTSTYSLMPG